jgi:hypothetical protein
VRNRFLENPPITNKLCKITLKREHSIPIYFNDLTLFIFQHLLMKLIRLLTASLFLICAFSVKAQKLESTTVKAKLLPTVKPVTIVPRVITPEEEKLMNEKREDKDRDDLRGRDTVKFRKNAPAFDKDPVVQQNYALRSVNQVSILNQFDAFNYQNVNPPDPSADAGLTQYITSTNGGSTLFAIYDKNGVLVQNNITFQSLGTLGAGVGDPIILFDAQNNRWMIAEMGNSNLRIYFSQTSNPQGSYSQYSIPTGSLPDYPKYGFWNDKLIITSNQGSGQNVYVLNKTNMIAGTPVTPITFFTARMSGFGFQATTPADVDGSAVPDASAPPVILRHRDDERVGSGTPDNTQDWLDYWNLNINFTTPASSTITGPISIGVAEFDSDLCGLTSFNCFPQPGTSTTLDPLREVLMYRVQYRRFPGYESMVMNWVTDVTGANVGGVRWTELRKTSGNWLKYQEGTFAPNDGLSRWMGSISQDKHGNIAMAYCVSSSTKFPSLRLTGRKLGDPLGQMTEPETEFATGTNRSTSNRWGDYQHMSVDPVTDENFWFTGLYGTSNVNWKTRVVHFKFNNCLNPFNSSASTNQNATCFGGNNGQITVTNTGGTGPFTYQLNGGTPQNNNVFTGLAAGTYTITVNDATGCSAIASATVTQPLQIGINKSIQNVLCNGASNGTITITATNTVGAVTYQLNSNPPQNSNIFNNLAAGNYNITVRDANNCSRTDTVTVNQPVAINASETKQNVSCFGGNNGSITINATGGTGTYQYRIGSGALQSSNTFNNLTAGNYNITILDANNCSFVRVVSITQPAVLTNAPVSENAKCFGEASGKITVTAGGGTAPYQYKIGASGTLQTSNAFNNLAAGNYNIVVRDANGCETTQTVTVGQPNAVTANLNAVNPDASNRFKGTLVVQGTGGVAPFQYAINGGAFQSSGDFSKDYILGQNTITIKDANGCTTVLNRLMEQVVTDDTWKAFTKLYPNPNFGDFYLEIRGIRTDQNFQVQVFDAKGAQVQQFQTGASASGFYLKQLNIQVLSAGMYTMKIVSQKNKGELMIKFVVSNK